MVVLGGSLLVGLGAIWGTYEFGCEYCIYRALCFNCLFPKLIENYRNGSLIIYSKIDIHKTF